MEQNQLEIHLDNQIYAAIFTRYYFVILSSKHRRMFKAGWNRIAKNTLDKLLKAGWGGIAENTWTSRGQSSDCQLANLWIGEVETNCRIVFCLVNPPTIKIPHLRAIHRHQAFPGIGGQIVCIAAPNCFS